ncbi:MAG: hypothetical protein JWN65_3683 [Solirubrobacterales bacterium]|nr:hypothetical protein [Solirubrobacterales bacterium]
MSETETTLAPEPDCVVVPPAEELEDPPADGVGAGPAVTG